MSWLHTWAGLVVGGVLFAVFWSGSLSVFDREIDRWMVPGTRLSLPDDPRPLEELRPLLERAAEAKATRWNVILPSEREPVIRVHWREADRLVVHLLDPRTGASLPDRGTWGGSQFFYPFHYTLNLEIADIGLWVVGLAAMTMLVLIVSGLVVHRKIFADLFTLRSGRNRRRNALDLHNVAGVLALPFHLGITLSGLIILFAFYFSGVWQVSYAGDRVALLRELYGVFQRPPAGIPGRLASLDVVAEKARDLWHGDAIRGIAVFHPGDANSYVGIRRASDRVISSPAGEANFDAATTALLHVRSAGPTMAAQNFIAALHLVQFQHWSLRWLYFGLGLTGCVLIATGFLFWLESRHLAHMVHGRLRKPGVDCLAIGSITGIVVATLALFAVNRLPLGQDDAALDIWSFYLAWLLSFAHAWLRPGQAWREQCWAIAALAVAAVLLNWMTTGDHLVRSLGHRFLWPVAGVDLMLLVTAAIAAFAALRLSRRRHP